MKLTEATERFTEREQVLAELGDVNDLEVRRSTISAQIKANKTKLANLNVSRILILSPSLLIPTTPARVI